MGGGEGRGRGYFAPVLATERVPYCFLAVTSQAIRAQARPSMGVRAAAARFCFFHIRVRVAGRTAEPMMTPWVWVRMWEECGRGGSGEITIIK